MLAGIDLSLTLSIRSFADAWFPLQNQSVNFASASDLWWRPISRGNRQTWRCIALRKVCVACRRGDRKLENDNCCSNVACSADIGGKMFATAVSSGWLVRSAFRA